MLSFFTRFLKTRAGRILTHGGFIATVLGLITFFLLDFSPDLYLLQIDKTKVIQDFPYDLYTHFGDLNSNGIQEQFHFANSDDSNAHCTVYKTGNAPLDQWNFSGIITKYTAGYYLSDFDKDLNKEISVFSLNGNAIYLNIIEPYGNTTTLVKNRLVDTLWSTPLNSGLYIYNFQAYDLNGDGLDEVVFSLNGGRALQPRKVYAYDIKADSLWSSPLSGTIYFKPLILDYDEDGKPELYCKNNGSNNYVDGNIPQPDTSSWFVVLDEHLRYKVPPLPLGGLFTASFPVLIENNEQKTLYWMVAGEQDSRYFSEYYLVNRDLTLTRANPLVKRFDFSPGIKMISASGRCQLLLDGQAKIHYFLTNGMITDSIKTGDDERTIEIENYDAGMAEFEYGFIMEGKTEHIGFRNSHGKRLGILEFDISGGMDRICWIGKETGHYQFLVSGQKQEAWISVRPNPGQYWQYAILIGLILGFYGFISMIRWIQSQQLARREAIRREVLELQLKAVRNQLDPHFTFNALNTLSGLSHAGDKSGVDHFISHFSQLLRTHLKTADQVLVSLREELEFVVNYVELQRIRFDNAFQLVVEIDRSIDQGQLIPKMMIQTHVENAIKHGIRGLIAISPEDPDGKVLVRITEAGGALVINIEDNGVGRGNSQISEFESTGKGMPALEKIRESVNKLYGIRIRQEVDDLFDKDGKPAGTRVRLEVDQSRIPVLRAGKR